MKNQVLWGKRIDTPWLKLTDNVSGAEQKRRIKDGWEVLALPVGESPAMDAKPTEFITTTDKDDVCRTTIITNGSTWNWQKPAPIAKLLELLENHPLDREFEKYGNFIKTYHEMKPKVVNFWGNFLGVSHVFNIDSNDPRIIETLTKAIRANQQRQDYLRQSNLCTTKF